MSQDEKTNQSEQPYGTLFGVLGYNNTEEFDDFINRLKNKSTPDVLLAIHSALRFSQIRGVFSLEESEVVSVALRNLQDVMKNSIPNK